MILYAPSLEGRNEKNIKGEKTCQYLSIHDSWEALAQQRPRARLALRPKSKNRGQHTLGFYVPDLVELRGFEPLTF